MGYQNKTDVLKQLKAANKDRCNVFGHEIADWTAPEWGNALAGETGELCNLVKKLHRGDEISIEDIGREAADVVCYLDLLCQKLGIDLQTAVVNKFNEVSEKKKSSIVIYYY